MDRRLAPVMIGALNQSLSVGGPLDQIEGDAEEGDSRIE
jgi:hypothetical protein